MKTDLHVLRNKTKLLVPSDSHTHPGAPVCVEPALSAGSHVTVFYINGPQIHVAFFIRNKVAHVAHTANISGPLTQPAWHWALQRQTTRLLLQTAQPLISDTHDVKENKIFKYLSSTCIYFHVSLIKVMLSRYGTRQCDSASVTDCCHSQRSTRSGSATHCRSSAGRYWLFRVSPGVGSGSCRRWGCGWCKPDGTGPAGAACPGHTSCCTRTTLRYPSWLKENTMLGMLHTLFLWTIKAEGNTLSAAAVF